jgi:hypothetical protein
MSPILTTRHAARAMHESVGPFLIWISVAVGVILIAAFAIFVLVRRRRRRRALPAFVQVRVNSVRRESTFVYIPKI